MTDFSRAKCIGKQDIFAKQICQRCPIKSDCLLWALERGELYGVWGGYDYDERCIIAPLKGFTSPSRREVEHGTWRAWAWHHSRNEEPCLLCRSEYNKRAAERMLKSRKRKASGQGSTTAE